MEELEGAVYRRIQCYRRSLWTIAFVIERINSVVWTDVMEVASRPDGVEDCFALLCTELCR